MGTHLTIFRIEYIFTVASDRNLISRPSLYENIIIEAVVSVKNGHKAHNLGAMRNVIWSVALS